MTVSSATRQVSYTGNGATVAFSVPFYFIESAHLAVSSIVTATGVSTLLVEGTDYTVTGAGVDTGGTVLMSEAPAPSVSIDIQRTVPLLQLMDYQENDSFPAASHEAALDLLTMQCQQIQANVDAAMDDLSSAVLGDLDLSGYQPVDADLTAIAALPGTTGKLTKTAANTWALDITNYSDWDHTHTGTYQPVDADLTAIAALPTSIGGAPKYAATPGFLVKTGEVWSLDTATYSPYGHIHSLTDLDSDYAGDGAVWSSEDLDGIQVSASLPISVGGTGATSAAGALTALGAAASGHAHTGTYQPLDATLTALAGVTTAADTLLYATGVDTFSTTTLTSAARSLLDDTNSSTMRTTLGLVIGTTVQAYSAKLAAIAALANSAGVLTNDGLGNFSYSASSGSGAITPSSVTCSGDGTFSGVLYAGYNIAGAYPSTGSPYGLAIVRNFSGSAAEVNFFNCATSGSGFDFRQMTGAAASTPAAVSMGALTATSGAFSGTLTGSGAGLTNIPLSALTTSVTGLLKGNGTAISAAVSGTDYQAPTVLWVKTSSTTLASWTTASTLIGAAGTGVGTLTLAANALAAGKTLRIKLMGVMSTAATAPTYQLALTLGGVAVCSTAAVSSTLSKTNIGWTAEFLVTCRSVGATGTVFGQGFCAIATTAQATMVMSTNTLTAATVDTTGALALDVSLACGTSSASNTWTCTSAVVEILS